jgi:hypothetical protein
MAIYAIIENGTVINVVEWDGVSNWSPPSGATALLPPDGTQFGVGYTYDGQQFVAPPPPPPIVL